MSEMSCALLPHPAGPWKHGSARQWDERSMTRSRVPGCSSAPQKEKSIPSSSSHALVGGLVGAVVADMLPYLLRKLFNVSNTTDAGNSIPQNVRISFYLGAVAFLGAVLWTIFSTKEYPPEDLEAFRRHCDQYRTQAEILKHLR